VPLPGALLVPVHTVAERQCKQSPETPPLEPAFKRNHRDQAKRRRGHTKTLAAGLLSHACPNVVRMGSSVQRSFLTDKSQLSKQISQISVKVRARS